MGYYLIYTNSLIHWCLLYVLQFAFAKSFFFLFPLCVCVCVCAKVWVPIQRLDSGRDNFLSFMNSQLFFELTYWKQSFGFCHLVLWRDSMVRCRQTWLEKELNKGLTSFLFSLRFFFSFPDYTVAVFRHTRRGLGPHYRCLWVTMWGLGVELRTCGRALNRWAISPALRAYVLILRLRDETLPLGLGWAAETQSPPTSDTTSSNQVPTTSTESSLVMPLPVGKHWKTWSVTPFLFNLPQALSKLVRKSSSGRG
jgi:hypothetical protein